MREISIDELKRIELEILDYVADYCKSNNLSYFLSDGTLLGAVRHNGFIPWDDDIDICMPRNDFNKLIALFNTNQQSEIYELVAPAATKSRYYYIKIIDTRTIKIEDGIKYNNDYLGVDIDVFPIDGSPDRFEDYDQRRGCINKLYRHYSTVAFGFSGSFKHKFKVLLLKALWGNKKSILSKATAICELNNYDSARYAARYGQFSLGFRVEKRCYEKSVNKLFEGKYYPVPEGYDEVLTAQFGDYMTLPPEEERATHHSGKAFWKE